MTYSPKYESSLIRGDEDSRPWNIINVIKRYLKPRDRLLDLGCGTVFKTIKLAPYVKEIIGLDISDTMLGKAKVNIKANKISNFNLVKGDSKKLSFPSESFSVVSCILAPFNPAEIHRVLKPKGWAIIEKTGNKDKWNFKQCFPDDKFGSRSYLADFRKEEMEKLFSKVEIKIGSWKTYYSIAGLILLLQETRTIRDFDYKKDKSIIEEIKKRYMTKRGIETTQQHILICAQK